MIAYIYLSSKIYWILLDEDRASTSIWRPSHLPRMVSRPHKVGTSQAFKLHQVHLPTVLKPEPIFLLHWHYSNMGEDTKPTVLLLKLEPETRTETQGSFHWKSLQPSEPKVLPINLLFTNSWSWEKSKSQKYQSQSHLARGPPEVLLQIALSFVLHLHLHAGARGTSNGMKMVKSPKVKLHTRQRCFTCIFPLLTFKTFLYWVCYYFLNSYLDAFKTKNFDFLHDSAFGTLVHVYRLQHWNS